MFYAHDLCISFDADRQYDFELIEVTCQHFGQIINNLLGLIFSFPKYKFIVFRNRKIVQDIGSLKLVFTQPMFHTRQLKCLGVVTDHQLSFTPHIEYNQKKCDRSQNQTTTQHIRIKIQRKSHPYKGLKLIINSRTLNANTWHQIKFLSNISSPYRTCPVPVAVFFHWISLLQVLL